MSSRASSFPQAARSLFEAAFDYAGLFPPAALSVPAAVRNYAAYLRGEHAWMLGRLVVPSASLPETSDVARPLLNRGHGAVPWRLAVVAGPDIEETIRFVERFNQTHSRRSLAGHAIVDAIEHRVARPNDVRHIDELMPLPVRSVYEIVPSADLEGVLRFVKQVDGVAKVRAGGLTADAVPPADSVARFIVTCARIGVPIKATAGLHHALRGVHPVDATDGPKAMMHGFLNLLVAAAIAKKRLAAGASEPDVQMAVTHVLEDARPGVLAFTDQGIEWDEFRIDAETVAATRRDLLLGVGSCSFDEPLAELRALGLAL